MLQATRIESEFSVIYDSDKLELLIIRYEFSITPPPKDCPNPRVVQGEHRFILHTNCPKSDIEEIIRSNEDELDIWADQRGQHLLFLLMFLDGFHEKLLHLVSFKNRLMTMEASVIRFLSKRSDLRCRLKPATYSNMLKQYYDRVLHKNGGQEPTYEFFAGDAAERWISHCMDDAPQEYDWFEYHPEENRECALLRVADKLNAERIRDCSRQTHTSTKAHAEGSVNRHALMERACGWLLRWYNLKEATKLGFDHWWQQVLILWAPEALAFLALVYVGLGPLCPDSWQSFLFSRSYPKLLYTLCFVAVLLFVAVTRLLNQKCAPPLKSTRRWHVLIPRLAAGITVGYFALLNADAWLGIFDARLYGPDCQLLSTPVLIRILLPLLAVFGYIYIEIGRRPGIQMNTQKASRIFFRGYAYSILLGLLFSDIFSASLLRDASASPYALKGAVSFIHPQVILYIAPLAYFIGLFLQLLWEDKSLTEGI